MDVRNDVAAALVRQLKAWGIDTVFGVAGGRVAPGHPDRGASFQPSGLGAKCPPPSLPRNPSVTPSGENTA